MLSVIFSDLSGQGHRCPPGTPRSEGSCLVTWCSLRTAAIETSMHSPFSFNLSPPSSPVLSPWSQFSSSGRKSWAVQGMQEIHEVTDLFWRGGTATGTGRAPGRRPGTTLAYPLALDRLPPPLVLSLQLGFCLVAGCLLCPFAVASRSQQP